MNGAALPAKTDAPNEQILEIKVYRNPPILSSISFKSPKPRKKRKMQKNT